ncbi:MAG: glycosyltransferase involved in cell wall biosynthesis [Planctomycetota bacterium]
MRVLITSPVFPPDLGGPAVYVPSFARYLLERGHQVKVVAFCSELEPKGFPFAIHAVPRGPLPLRYLKAFFAVLKEAKDVDIVYVQEHLALLHVLAARLRGKPVVIRIMVDGAWEIAHRKGWCGDDDIVTFQTKRYDWRVKLTRFLQKRWWGWCTHIISCSEFLRQILLQSYGVSPNKVQKIFNAYHGTPPSEVSTDRIALREELGLRPETRYILTICRLMVWKGVSGILEALAKLPTEAHLLIAGDGDMEEPWKELARELGIAERVTFLGNVPHARIPLYVRASDVFVLNSRYEGLSHTLLEVLHLDTVMIASNVCGNPEVVQHEKNGLLVDPHNPQELADAIERLLGDPELCERYIAAARDRRGEFNRETNFAQVEEALMKASGQVE